MQQQAPDARFHRLVSALLAREVGAGASWRIYDRSLRTPMNFALDVARQQLTDEFTVIWVDRGYPEVFTLTGVPTPTAIFSARYLELSSFVRKLFVDESISNFRSELAERAALKVVAELSLRRGNPEAAVRCFVRSVTGKSTWLPDTNVMQDLELGPITEAYMAVWFFGLLHELGHSSAAARDPTATGLLGTAVLEQAVQFAIEGSAIADQLDIVEEMAIIRSDPQHPLRAEHLRGEVAADIFAVSVLLQATLDILAEVGERRLDPTQYIAEMTIAAQTIMFIERCEGIAEILAGDATPQMLRRYVVQPAGHLVRLRVVNWYLSVALANYYGGEDAAAADRSGWERAVDDISGSASAGVSDVEPGLAQAMTFALWPDDAPSTSDLLAQLHGQFEGDVGLTLLEAKEFCALADTRGIRDPYVDALKRIIEGEAQRLGSAERHDGRDDLRAIRRGGQDLTGTSRFPAWRRKPNRDRRGRPQ